ncbi:MAG: GNAT family N-acetyltransferase [Erysipelotrichaceae bacterium]|nr:GNAT family N-acetyltransferase [Erysipelotrichaceae bacterium]MDY5252525.1 GNAT family N-acetyltransferase [Erysipelotrichaceae bacterium]
MEIRLARQEDILAISKLFDQAIAYFKQHAIDQWQNGYPNQDTIVNDVANGWGYVAIKDGKIVGYSAIIMESDPNYEHIEDGAWLNERPYGVIHRVVVDNECKGQGIGSWFFDHAQAMAEKKGYQDLRVDTHKDNISMQHLIQKNGFSKCGIIYVEDGTPRYAYHKVFNELKK